MQYRIPMRILDEISLKLAENFCGKNVQEYYYLQCIRQINMHFLFHDRREKEKEKHKHAYKSIFKISEHYTAHKSRYNKHAEYYIYCRDGFTP